MVTDELRKQIEKQQQEIIRGRMIVIASTIAFWVCVLWMI